MVKKYTSLLLIGMLVIHLAGFYVYFIVRLGDLRMDMREKLAELPADQLETVRIPLHQFKTSWIEDKEMKWQGKMFDIARVERQDDIVIVYCIHDKDEDGLLSFIGAVIDMSQQDTQSAPSSITQFFSLKCILAPLTSPERPVREITSSVCPYQVNFNPVFILPVTPPPRS
jgi:hypothetical protein